MPMHGVARQLQDRQLGTVADRLAIFSHEAFDSRLACSGGLASFAATEDEASGQPLDVPLPRTRHGFIEVVDVKHQSARGRGESAKIAYVGIPANLNRDTGGGERGQVGRHHRHRAAEKAEGRSCHACPLDGQKF